MNKPNRSIACLAVSVALVGFAMLVAAARVDAGPEIPGRPQERPIVLAGATIHPVDGPEIRDGLLVFDRGRIVAVGKQVAVPANAERIELPGQHIYPGLIDAFTQLGLYEIPTVRATVDHTETGSINPNVRALVSINPDSELIPVARANGVLLTLTAPNGGLFSGISALIQLDGWTHEEMAVRPEVGLHVGWPRMAPVHGWWIESPADEQLASRDSAPKEIRQTFANARQYWLAKQAFEKQAGSQPDYDPRWEAMIPVLEGRRPLFAEADDLAQIQSAVAFAAREGIKLVLVGGGEMPECIDLLKKHDVPVVIRGIQRLPPRNDDAYDAAYTVPARLHAAGIRFCIASGGRSANIRNLAFQAGLAVAHGLPAETALRAITLSAAEILGAGERVGSLAAGKDATLIVTSGDPLEIPTQVTQAFVQGRRVDLSNRHIQLWKKYQEKYRRQDAALVKPAPPRAAE